MVQGQRLPSPQAYKPSSNRTQESRPQAKGSSETPESTSSKILWPGYKRTSWSRAQATRIKVFLLCLIWKDIWWGENLTKLDFFRLVTFNSTVKKFPLGAYPKRSGVPNKAQFSSLVHVILLDSFFNFFQSSRSVIGGLTRLRQCYNLPMIFPILYGDFLHRKTNLWVSLSPKIAFSSSKTSVISYISPFGNSTWTLAFWATSAFMNFFITWFRIFPVIAILLPF